MNNPIPACTTTTFDDQFILDGFAEAYNASPPDLKKEMEEVIPSGQPLAFYKGLLLAFHMLPKSIGLAHAAPEGVFGSREQLQQQLEEGGEDNDEMFISDKHMQEQFMSITKEIGNPMKAMAWMHTSSTITVLLRRLCYLIKRAQQPTH